MPSSCSPGSTKHSGAPVSRIGSLEGRRAASTLQAARWPIARPNECFCPFGLHTFCVLSFTSYQVGVVTTLWVPERSAVNRCRERFRRVEVRVLRRSYLISRAAYLYPSHSTACLFTSCTRVVPNQHVVLAVIQDPFREHRLLYLQNLDLPQALRGEKILKSSARAFFSFLVGPG